MDCPLRWGRAGDDRLWEPSTVLCVQFSRELRNDVLAGDITVSVRLWTRPKVKEGGRYRIGDDDTLVYRVEFHAVDPPIIT